MDAVRATVFGTVAVIGVVTILTGPLVSEFDVTDDRSQPSIVGNQTDSISASTVSVPESGIRFERDRFGAGTYQLMVPDAELYIEEVTGTPRIIYRLNIPGLHYSRGTILFIDSSQEGSRLTLEFESKDFTPSEVTQERYAGRLAIVTLDSSGSTDVYSENVTISVEK